MQTRQLILNFIIILLVSLALIGLQSAFWYRVFTNTIAPLVWLNVSLYLMLFRKPTVALIQIYILCVFWRFFSATPIGIWWSLHLITFAIVWFVKKRVFWPSMRYFLIASAGVTTLYEILFPLLTMVFEPQTAGFHPFYRLAEIFVTTCTAVPVYLLLSKVDDLTSFQHLPETSAGGMNS